MGVPETTGKSSIANESVVNNLRNKFDIDNSGALTPSEVSPRFVQQVGSYENTQDVVRALVDNNEEAYKRYEILKQEVDFRNVEKNNPEARRYASARTYLQTLEEPTWHQGEKEHHHKVVEAYDVDRDFARENLAIFGSISELKGLDLNIPRSFTRASQIGEDLYQRLQALRLTRPANDEEAEGQLEYWGLIDKLQFNSDYLIEASTARNQAGVLRLIQEIDGNHRFLEAYFGQVVGFSCDDVERSLSATYRTTTNISDILDLGKALVQITDMVYPHYLKNPEASRNVDWLKVRAAYNPPSAEGEGAILNDQGQPISLAAWSSELTSLGVVHPYSGQSADADIQLAMGDQGIAKGVEDRGKNQFVAKNLIAMFRAAMSYELDLASQSLVQGNTAKATKHLDRAWGYYHVSEKADSDPVKVSVAAVATKREGNFANDIKSGRLEYPCGDQVSIYAPTLSGFAAAKVAVSTKNIDGFQSALSEIDGYVNASFLHATCRYINLRLTEIAKLEGRAPTKADQSSFATKTFEGYEFFMAIYDKVASINADNAAFIVSTFLDMQRLPESSQEKSELIVRSKRAMAILHSKEIYDILNISDELRIPSPTQ